MLTVLRRALLVLAATTIFLGLWTIPASAHPLGNFTVNRYARVELSAAAVRVYYVLDEAEIPAYQDQPAVDANRDDFIRMQGQAIASRLQLTIDGNAVPLVVRNQLLTQPIGQGGLHTLRLAFIFEAASPVPGMQHDAILRDDNAPDRTGWREIVVEPAGNAVLSSSNVATRDQSNALRSYPSSALQQPLDVRTAAFHFDPGTVSVAAQSLDSPTKTTSRSGGAFTALINHPITGPLTLLGLLALAFAGGVLHALGPGHGKSIMAAYLVGTRGRSADALLLGGIVSLMHTGSVLIIGFAIAALDLNHVNTQIYPTLTVLSGLLVLSIGLRLTVRRWRSFHHSRQHLHHHAHSHDHGNGGHGHGHSHELPEDVAPLSRRGLIALASAGGILPSPSAIVVLLAAFSLGRLPLGLALIGSFSLGLAAMLTVVGLALVHGRRAIEARSVGRSQYAASPPPRSHENGQRVRLRSSTGRFVPALPLIGACSLVALGVAVSIHGLIGFQ